MRWCYYFYSCCTHKGGCRSVPLWHCWLWSPTPPLPDSLLKANNWICTDVIMPFGYEWNTSFTFIIISMSSASLICVHERGGGRERSFRCHLLWVWRLCMYLTGLGMGHRWTGILLIRFLKIASDSKNLRHSLLLGLHLSPDNWGTSLPGSPASIFQGVASNTCSCHWLSCGQDLL